MIRWLLLAVLIVAISATAAWFALSTPSADLSPGTGLPVRSTLEEERKGPPPSLVLEGETTYDFGVLGQNEVESRDFVIRNEGPGDLILTGTVPSCSCTFGNLGPGESTVVKPGDSFTVTVRWETRQFEGPYKQDAGLETNDPKQPRITFHITGKILPDLVTLPEDGFLNVRQITSDQPHTAYAVIAAPARPETKITALTTSRPDLLKVSHRPLTEEETKKLDLEGGHRIDIEIQPTTELGPFREEIVVTTDNPKVAERRLTIYGTIVGPISFMPETVRLSDVISNRGAQATVFLWVRGQPETHFTVAKKPDALNVAIVPADDRGTQDGASGKAGRSYRMTVSVQPGTQPQIIREPIVLKTDHPDAAEVHVPVHIQVLGAG